MKNWSTETTELVKDKTKFAVWTLEQQVNFGLDKEKINIVDLRKYWDLLDIDPSKRKFLALFV